jgi:hypothetical protein
MQGRRGINPWLIACLKKLVVDLRCSRLLSALIELLSALIELLSALIEECQPASPRIGPAPADRTFAFIERR